jgi:phosphoribosyl-AMP cyclohydrolase
MNVKTFELEWEKMNNLIPVIVQEEYTGDILTLAYVNMEALKKTMETGFAHYYRRSHCKVMKKGITSGNVQRIKDILTDCDNDALIYIVDKTGPACHLGRKTCFHNKVIK